MQWGLPNARLGPELPDAAALISTPLHDLLRAGAAIDPTATALTGQNGRIDYATMMRLAEASAAAIASRVAPGRPVACLLPRTPEAVTALIGCLISGRPCLVLDPAYPPDRQAALLEDAAPDLVLAANKLPFDVPLLELNAALTHSGDGWEPDTAWDPDTPFAVHFTSGSSGRPKGIVLSARSVLYRGLDVNRTSARTRHDRVLMTSVPVRSNGLSTLLGVLFAGANVVLVDLARDGANAVLRLIERQGVTHLSVPQAVLRLWFQLNRADEALRSLRAVRMGLGAVRRAELKCWRPLLPADCVVLHTYASTEALIVAQWFVPLDEDGPEPTLPAGIIEPLHEYAVLDEQGQSAGPGQPGELVMRGPYLALGEWSGGRLVAGRLKLDPDRPGWRIFHSGDLVRVQPDGMLRILGRVDRQVKIHGVRIEPAEIEAVLLAHPAVTDAAVVACAGASEPVLQAFVVASGSDRASLLADLRGRMIAALPSSARPSRLTVLERLPSLPSGKVDLVTLAQWHPA